MKNTARTLIYLIIPKLFPLSPLPLQVEVMSHLLYGSAAHVLNCSFSLTFGLPIFLIPWGVHAVSVTKIS